MLLSLEQRAAEHPFHSKLRQEVRPRATLTEDGIAILPVEGVLARKPDLFEILELGFEDTSEVLGMVETAASNPQVRGILLSVDSPGGFLTGGPEVADAVREALKSKPVVTWTGGTMASLAYWIGSQASTVVASRSAQVGSIGVYATHVDYSKVYERVGLNISVFKNKEADYKAAGVHGTALTEEQKAHIQDGVQKSFREFKRSVASARPQVAEEAMRGQVLYGSEAKGAGLVDRIGDQSFALGLLRSQIRARKSA